MECQICHRGLTDAVSIARGYGAECAKKYRAYLTACGVDETEIARLEALNDINVNRFLRFVRIEIARSARRAQFWLESARGAARRAEQSQAAVAA